MSPTMRRFFLVLFVFFDIVSGSKARFACPDTAAKHTPKVFKDCGFWSEIIEKAINEKIKETMEKLHIQDDMEKKLFILLLKRANVPWNSPEERMTLLMVVFKPSKIVSRPERFEDHYSDELTIRVTKLRTPDVTRPMAILSTIRYEKKEILVLEEVLFYGANKEWQTSREKSGER
jgi:hypothetical protein